MERVKGEKRNTNRRRHSLLLLSSQLLMYSLLSRGEEQSSHGHFSLKLPVYGDRRLLVRWPNRCCAAMLPRWNGLGNSVYTGFFFLQAHSCWVWQQKFTPRRKKRFNGNCHNALYNVSKNVPHIFHYYGDALRVRGASVQAVLGYFVHALKR